MAGQIAGLVSKEETVEEILKDLSLRSSLRKIQEEASRWAGVVRNDVKQPFYLLVKVPSI